MNAPRFRKLIDIEESATRRHGELKTWLDRRSIHFKTNRHSHFIRYFVHENDLCYAQSLVMAIDGLAETEACK